MKTELKSYAVNGGITALMTGALLYDIEAVENLAWFAMMVIGFLTMIVVFAGTDETIIGKGESKKAPGVWIFSAANVVIAASLGWFFTAFWYGLWWGLYKARVIVARDEAKKASNA